MTTGIAFTRKIKTMTPVKNNEFLTWLIQETQRRGWNDSELARRAGINQSTISRVVNGDRGVTCEFVIATAQAVGADPVWALRLADILPDIAPSIAEEQEAIGVLRALPPAQRSSALLMLRGLAGSGADRPKVEPGPADRQPETIPIGQTRQYLLELLYTNRGLPVPRGGEIPVTVELVNVLFDEIERHEQDIDRLAEYFFAVTLRNVRGALVEKFAKAAQLQAEQMARKETPEQ